MWTPEDSIRRTPEAMLREFNEKFSYMADSFMNEWGDYIGDAEQIDSLIENAFENWVSTSGWFEQ